MKKTATALAIAAAIVIPALAGCGKTSTGSSAQAARSDLGAAASATAVTSAEAKAKTDIIDPCITSATGIASFRTCVEGKIPAGKRTQVRDCLATAALSAHLATAAGRQQYMTVTAPQCVAAVMP